MCAAGVRALRGGATCRCTHPLRGCAARGTRSRHLYGTCPPGGACTQRRPRHVSAGRTAPRARARVSARPLVREPRAYNATEPLSVA